MIFLPDSKTGQKPVYLNAPALDVLATLPRQVANPHVICGHRGGGALGGVDKIWRRVPPRRRALQCAATRSAPFLRQQAATTERYSHLPADPVRHVAEAIGQRISTESRAKPTQVTPT